MAIYGASGTVYCGGFSFPVFRWEERPAADKGITVDNSPMHGYFVYRGRDGVSEFLHKDGTWHRQCGLPNFYASEREATVAAVLAGMESPEVKALKEANAIAQRRLAAKQAVVDQVCKERDQARAGRDGAVSWADALAAEVAKLRGNLAQAIVPDPSAVFVAEDPQGVKRLRDCAAIARGEPVDNPDTKSIAVKAVRKLRADYEHEKKRAADFVSAVERNGPLLAAIRQVAEGGPCPWAGPQSDTLDSVKRMRADYDALLRAGRYYADGLSAANGKIRKAREALA
jgi:hypothetical protein